MSPFVKETEDKKEDRVDKMIWLRSCMLMIALVLKKL